ncbi:MAG: tetratricopeptide repeat protein [Betaproteobacteria bacterium]|jgi:Flp pilus assembly protein TadD|nr:tetratricopeptide repeat protein [Betaproteobacteria bacterium]
MRTPPTCVGSSAAYSRFASRAIPALCALVVLLAAPLTARADALEDADLLLRAGRAAQALEQVDEYLAKHPADMQARFLKGLILAEQKRESEAIDVFVRLTQDNPEYAEPYNNLAVLYAARGNLEGARKALETAVRVNPKYITAQENLGDVYARLAAAAYERAAALGGGSKAVSAKLRLSRDLVAAGVDKSDTEKNR